MRRLAALGLAAQLLNTLTWVAAGLFDPRFSFVHNDTSDLGARTARHALPYNIGLSVSGGLTLMLAAGLWLIRPGPRRRLWSVGVFLVAVFAVGELLDGVLREDCAVSVDAACRAAAKAGRVSWQHQAHDIESLATFAALVLAPLFVGLACRQREEWRALAPWSFAVCGVQAVALPVFLALYDKGSNGQGVVEIVEITAGVAWLAIVSYRLRSPELAKPSIHPQPCRRTTQLEQRWCRCARN